MKAIRLLNIIVLIIITLLPHICFAANFEKQGNTKSSWDKIFIPVFFYSPDTKTGLGILGILVRDKGVADNKPDTIQGPLLITQENQIIAVLDSTIYKLDGSWRFKNKIKLSKFPDSFYGIGPDTTFSMKEDYTSHSVSIKLGAAKGITDNLYIGALFDFDKYTISDKERGGKLENNLVVGSGSDRSSGIGFSVSMDTRDNVFYTLSGSLINLEIISYEDWLGSDNDYKKLHLNAKHFINITGKQVVGINGIVDSCKGNVPFQNLPFLGGSSLLRGYTSGRYRDKHFFGIQSEYRTPIYERLGLVLFGGFAQVAPVFSDRLFKGMKKAGGLGIRYTVNSKENINIRLDFAVNSTESGDEANAFYFFYNESF
ncbi:MAG: BamA/TamA family outer membrane protein [bacterium]